MLILFVFFLLDVVQALVNLIQTRSPGYAPCHLANIYKTNLCLDAELLVDCGCSVDLILPSREIEELQLRKESGGISARGFNSRITILPKYEDVKITVNLKHSITGHITTKTAIISVFEGLPLFTSAIGIQCSNDMLSDETQTTASRLWSPQRTSEMTTSTMSIDDNPESNVTILKLSPLKHPIEDGDRYGILGYPAMKKLNIGVHFGGNYIFGVQRVLEYISSISASKTD